jgi:hypothetical protein
VVGQYFRMRRRYASREIVGTLRAWKVRTEEGVEMEVRDAVVRVRQMGASVGVTVARVVRVGVVDGGVAGATASSLSFVAAIWAKREARRRRRSGEGYECTSKGSGSGAGAGAGAGSGIGGSVLVRGGSVRDGAALGYTCGGATTGRAGGAVGGGFLC